ncbi:MAG: hypothetical protein WC820_02400 [Spirochaetales bacterium]|jgi:hypothetical protein
MNSDLISKVTKAVHYRAMLLLKADKKLGEALQNEEDPEIKYHFLFERDIAKGNYDKCFDVLKKAQSEKAIKRKDIELFIKGILAKYEKDKNYKKVIDLAQELLSWSCVDTALKSLLYHLLGNSYYFSNKEQELVDLIEFLKRDKDYQNHPLVRWANSAVKLDAKNSRNL